MWKMVHQENAIEALAFTLRFAEPVGSVVGKRVVRELESAASKAGLIDKQPLQQFRFEISGANAGIQQSSPNGMIFQENSLVRNEDGVVLPLLASQLSYQPEQMIVQIHRYRRWADELEKILGLVTDALKIALATVPIGSLRLEYLDRFVFDGEPTGSFAKGLLKPSGMIAGHIFDSTDMWHSHTGRFADIQAASKRLDQVNADLQILNPPHKLAGTKTLALVTAVERQYDRPGFEVEIDGLKDFLSTTLDVLHQEAIGLFKDVIDSEFALANGLPK